MSGCFMAFFQQPLWIQHVCVCVYYDEDHHRSDPARRREVHREGSSRCGLEETIYDDVVAQRVERVGVPCVCDAGPGGGAGPESAACAT